MRSPTLHELEVALFVEMVIGGLFAVLIPLGMSHLAAGMAATARHAWTEWKLDNDRRNNRADLIIDHYTQQLKASSGPNRVRSLKRKRQREQEGIAPGKRRYTGFNHSRALRAIREDWYADIPHIPRPKFTDLDFQQTFGVTRTHIQDIILPACTRHRPDIFCGKADAAQRVGIAPIVKILNALKMARFGVPAACFKDYFQMGETSARYAFHALMDSMANDDAVSAKFRRVMTRTDLARVMAMHHEQHGVNGMAFSIDCWHLSWKNCPSAWKGQLEGKEGVATLVMEAGVDHNLWFWHAVFGFPGTMNDIQIWDQSQHYHSLYSGEWAKYVDPTEPFTIGSLSTTRAFFPVDGIYPLLSRFCKTITEPQNPEQVKYAAWQVAVRKDVERGFGVLGSKFRILIRPVEFHQPRDIANLVYGCVALHNMMVEYRLSLGQEESAELYKISDSLNQKIHGKTNVWIQPPVDNGSNAMNGAMDSLDNEQPIEDLLNNPINADFDPREYLVRGHDGALLLQKMHSHLTAETNLEDPTLHFELQQAIIDELSL